MWHRGGPGRKEAVTAARTDDDEIVALPARHVGRWVAVAVAVVLVAMAIHSLVVEPGFQWRVVGQYFAASTILTGIRLTIELTAIVMVVGITLGMVLAIMRLSSNPILSGVSRLYTWFFRGTPVLVQLIFWYNLGALFSHLSLGIPFGSTFVSVPTNSAITPLVAAILGLGLNEGAYMGEIVRGGLLSVPTGQVEAAASLGMSNATVMWRIVLPQAMRAIVPPTSNEVIGMLKWTSLVSVIALADLLYSVELIYGRNYETIPLLIVASLWYLIMTTVLSVGQYYVERRFSRDTRGTQGGRANAGSVWRRAVGSRRGGSLQVGSGMR